MLRRPARADRARRGSGPDPTAPAGAPAGAPARLPAGVPAGLCAAAVLTQVAYPLLRGRALRRATTGSVVLFAAASLTDLARRGRPRDAVAALLVAGGTGLAAEVVGTRTGHPFGPYRYAGTLGPQVADVPVVVPLAWTMLAVPSVHLGRVLAAGVRPARRRTAAAAAAAWTLASWDLFLDPQMTAAGHWSFARPAPALPGSPGIPLSNYAGWLLVSTVLTGLLERALPQDLDGERPGQPPAAVPVALLGWTWLGSALGNLAFFRRPAVAAYGAAGMGLTVAPLLRRALRARRG